MFDYFKSKDRLHKEKKMLIEENLKLQEHIKATRKYTNFLAEEVCKYREKYIDLKQKLEATTVESKTASNI
jgi:hypothetical protein